MQIILCTGDSHTWGQGAAGWKEAMPDVKGGDRRPLPFNVPGYVNEIRRNVEEKTNSYSFEITSVQMQKDGKRAEKRDCIAITETNPYTLEAEGELFAFFYYAEEAEQGITVLCDGEPVIRDIPTRFGTDLSYNRVVLKATPGKHTLTVMPTGNEAYLYRVEGYGGQCAVINSGIGGCPAYIYINEHWRETVEVIKPDIAIVEPHTINDWLSPETPQEYYNILQEYFDRLKKAGVRTVMLTVAPIFGPTAQPYSPSDFSEYAKMAKKAAADFQIRIADVHKILAEEIKGLSEEKAFSLLADDIWHPNTYGHSIYAEETVKLLSELDWI